MSCGMSFTPKLNIMSNLFSAMALGVTALILAQPANAQEARKNTPHFGLPADCIPGKDCWLYNYVDMDAAEGQSVDFRCNPRSYDGHKGTDIALRSMAEMRTGINALAARDGTVFRIRDGEEDILKTNEEILELREKRKECGNGVLIDHGAALFSQYCHLKKDSITVKEGDSISKGDIIGQIGASGAVSIPQIELSIYWEGSIIDPFTGRTPEQGCGAPKSVFWEQPPAYQHAALYDGGFTPQVPNFKNIENGAPKIESLSSASEIFVFWAAFLGAQQGDKITLAVLTQDGQLALKRDIVQDKNQARAYHYLGKRFTSEPLPAGTYTGVATLDRTGFQTLKKSYRITVQ